MQDKKSKTRQNCKCWAAERVLRIGDKMLTRNLWNLREKANTEKMACLQLRTCTDLLGYFDMTEMLLLLNIKSDTPIKGSRNHLICFSFLSLSPFSFPIYFSAVILISFCQLHPKLSEWCFSNQPLVKSASYHPLLLCSQSHLVKSLELYNSEGILGTWCCTLTALDPSVHTVGLGLVALECCSGRTALWLTVQVPSLAPGQRSQSNITSSDVHIQGWGRD